MKSVLTKAIRSLLSSDNEVPKHAADVLLKIASDLSASEREVSLQREKVKDAIDNGTRIAKRRIPL